MTCSNDMLYNISTIACYKEGPSCVCVCVCAFTLEVMNSSLVSISGVRRQARNLRDVREVRSCNRPTLTHTHTLEIMVPEISEKVMMKCFIKDREGEKWAESEPSVVISGLSPFSYKIATHRYLCATRNNPKHRIFKLYLHMLVNKSC